MIRIKKKKAVSKTVLKFQEKEGSESGLEEIDKYVTAKELAVYDFDGEKIKGENKFKTYKK